jgi:hypothetical protein
MRCVPLTSASKYVDNLAGLAGNLSSGYVCSFLAGVALVGHSLIVAD